MGSADDPPNASPQATAENGIYRINVRGKPNDYAAHLSVDYR